MTSRGRRPAQREEPLASALAYLRRGWSVIPARRGGKVPLVSWEEFQHRRASEEELKEWFDRWPGANVAVVTGAISGIAVLDCDPRHGGESSLGSFEFVHGVPPPTPEVETGGGGRHLYFRLSGSPLRTSQGIAPGLDFKSEGGLVLVPPSIHPSGKPYVWRPDRAPGQVALAPVPEWLVELTRAEAPRRGHPLSYWREMASVGVEEGKRNSAVASFTGHLLWHGLDPEVALELMLCWNRFRCHPPLSDDEVARTVASIARTHVRAEEEIAP